jgi:hypothetical protein
MNIDTFEQYLDHLAAGIGHADRIIARSSNTVLG